MFIHFLSCSFFFFVPTPSFKLLSLSFFCSHHYLFSFLPPASFPASLLPRFFFLLSPFLRLFLPFLLSFLLSFFPSFLPSEADWGTRAAWPPAGDGRQPAGRSASSERRWHTGDLPFPQPRSALPSTGQGYVHADARGPPQPSQADR